MKPQCVVIAGPNGAGKSSAAPELLKDTLGVSAFVNADVIAQGLSGFRPEALAFEAGRIMRNRIGDDGGTMKERSSEEIARMFLDGRAIDQAFAAAYRRTVLRHRQAGVPLVVWRNGTVVEVSADRIELEADASAPAD